MKLIEFPEQTAVIAKDQPEYLPLPAHISKYGVVTCCWELSKEEIKQIQETGVIWHQVLTFNQPLQPQRLQLDKPDLRDAVEKGVDLQDE